MKDEFGEALELVVVRSRHEHFRWLTSDENPDGRNREAYRRLVAAQAEDLRRADLKYPSVAAQAVNAIGAAAQFVRSGFRTTPEEVYQARLAVCRKCPLFDAGQERCRACGCYSSAKLKIAAQSCPHPEGPRWTAVS